MALVGCSGSSLFTPKTLLHMPNFMPDQRKPAFIKCSSRPRPKPLSGEKPAQINSVTRVTRSIEFRQAITPTPSSFNVVEDKKTGVLSLGDSNVLKTEAIDH